MMKKLTLAAFALAAAGMAFSTPASAQQNQIPEGWFKLCQKQKDSDVCNVQFIKAAKETGQLLVGISLIEITGKAQRRIMQITEVMGLEGDTIILDGNTGTVVVQPDADTVEQYRRRVRRQEETLSSIVAASDLESVTLDGTHIQLLCNIEFPREIESVIRFGGEGVGLYRTEFLYLTNRSDPTEDELYEQYAHCIKLLDGRPLTVRTLDLGADKFTQQQAMEPERNPFLGLRSIRYSLQHLPQFKRQLRAILRASVHGPLKIMFPLITTMTELKQAKLVLEDAREELEEEGVPIGSKVPVGMMMEVPSAALMASSFARDVDFFSIGTNDLIQYTVAVDRSNQRVASLYTATNPGVLRLVKAILRAGKRRNIETSLCGEIAGDITYTMLLIGLGLRTLSLVPAQVPRVKQVIRRVDVKQCERLARRERRR